jgi:phage terminase small subunit
MPSREKKFLTQVNRAGRGLPEQVEERLRQPVTLKRERRLTDKEWKFVHELVAGEGHVTLKEAALRAGYSPKWIEGGGAKALTSVDRSPHIVAAIQKLRAEMAEKYGTTYERHMRDLQIIRDQALAAGAFGAAVQAEYRRGQALGSIYIDRKEIRHGTIDSMSKEEVMRKLEEIKKLYGGSPVIDLVPEQVVASLSHEDAEVVTVEPQDEEPLELSPPVEETHAEEARKPAVREAAREPIQLPAYPD